MRPPRTCSFGLALLACLTLPGCRAGERTAPAPRSGSSAYVEVRGCMLYFETQGSGPPLLYLHGGLSSGRDFDRYLPAFAERFEVVRIDRRGHGRSFDTDAPYTYADMADEIAAFLALRDLPRVHVLGWSDGGVVGYHLASRYPDRVRALIAVGANSRVDGMTESSVQWIRTQLTEDGIARSYPEVATEYRALNPDPGSFPRFLERTRDLWLRDPYITEEELGRIQSPVLLVAGDRDDIRLEHMVEMHRLLSRSELCILPGTDHFLFDDYRPAVARVLLEFLERQEAAPDTAREE